MISSARTEVPDPNEIGRTTAPPASSDFLRQARSQTREGESLSIFNLFLMAQDTAGLNAQASMNGSELFDTISNFVNSIPELRDLKLSVGNQEVSLGAYIDNFADRAKTASRDQTEEYMSRGDIPLDSDIRFSSSSSLLHSSLSRFRETSDFGARNTGIRGASTFHKGLDIGTPIGTDLRTTTDAEVAFVGRGVGGYGNLAILNHGDGVFTLYGHLSDIDVRRGDKISAGQVFAESGDTGIGNAHLHFEVIVAQNGRLYNIDPELVIDGRVDLSSRQGRDEAIEMTARQNHVQEARLVSRIGNQVLDI